MKSWENEDDYLDDVILNKVAIIEKRLKRIREEYEGHEKELEINITKQDSIILNLQRACEAAIDLGTYLIRLKKMGIPQSSREMFTSLEKAKFITPLLSQSLQAMVGFRNIAVHDYQKINLEIVKNIIEVRLTDFQDYAQCVLKQCQV